MPVTQERAPQGRETLVFSSSEKAQEFAERVEGKAASETTEGVRRDREILAEEVAVEFAKHGEGVNALHQPWEHSPEEHEETQQLVNMAFNDDLPVALKQAQGSERYPRNVDLFHDVLVDQLYDALVQRGLNKQRLPRWPLVILAGVFLLAFGLIIWLLV